MDTGDTSWQEIAELIPHIVWVASPDGTTEYLNRQATEYLGCPVGLSPADTWRDVLHPHDAAEVYEAWLHAVRSGTPYVAEYRLRRFDGEFRWHCGRGLPVRDDSGAITTWIGSATDIDDYKRSAAALRGSAARLAAAQRLTHVGSWFIDFATGTHTWSEELFRLMGYEPSEFKPDKERFFGRLHRDDVTLLEAAVLHHLRGETWEGEFRVVLPGGDERWLTARTEPVVAPSGEVTGVHGTAQDITERKLAERRLRFQADLLNAVGEAVVATDLTGSVLYWGPGAETLYGWSAEEALDRSVMDLIPTVEDSYLAAEAKVRLATGAVWAGSMKLRRRDGSTFTAEVSRTPVLGASGQLVANIGISSDVSEREAARLELELAHRTSAEAVTLLDTLQAEAPVGFAFVDRDLRFVRINRKLASTVGVPSHELIGQKVPDVLPAVLWDQVAPAYRHVLATGEAVRNQPVQEPAGGGVIRERTTSHYAVRVGDEIIGVGVVVNDVTDRVRAEGFRSAVMGQVADGVYTQDCDGRLMYMNSAASRMLGWTEMELRGKHIHDAVHFQDADGTAVGAADCALLTEGCRGPLERTGEAFTRKDGSIFPVTYSAVPLLIGSRVEGVAVVFRDVSDPEASPNMIRVLIVDSDAGTTESFRALLDRHEGIEVSAVATTSASAVERAHRLSPDVVLISMELPDLDGLATTARIKAVAPLSRVILMTRTHDDAMAIAGIEAGCAGVLDKSRAWVDLISAVRAAYHGETIIPQEELQRVLAKVRGGGGRATHLTDREEEVLSCMRDGLSNAQVAERLGVTANTVRNHVQRILYKLNVHSKLEAVVLTSREGLQRGQA